MKDVMNEINNNYNKRLGVMEAVEPNSNIYKLHD